MTDANKDSLGQRLTALLPKTNKQARQRAKEIREAMLAIKDMIPGSKPKKRRKKPRSSTATHRESTR